MYGLPKDFDGSFFLGSRLEQICVSVNTITFHFDREIMITLESGYTCNKTTDSADAVAYQVPAFQPELTTLLEQAVSDVIGSNDGTLTLAFGNGYSIAFCDIPQYEAYHIRYGDRVITV